MNFKDLLQAIEDMLKFHEGKEDDIIYIKTENGEYKPIDGFAFLVGRQERIIIIE